MLYDIVVIGAGPAGLIAAGRAAQLGAKTLLVEKNQRPGLKLLATGGGRCNITNISFDNRKLAEQYGPAGRFLLSALAQFEPDTTRDFFHHYQVPTVVEGAGQIFPKSNKANDVLNALLKFNNQYKVEFLYGCNIISLEKSDNKISCIHTSDGQKIFAKNFIIATGGKSYPETGSSGDAYAWLKKIGHNIIEPRAALVPLILDFPCRELEGLSLESVKLSWQENNEQHHSSGPIIFTARGLSGPAALNLSRFIANTKKGTLTLDLFPEAKDNELEQILQKLLHKDGAKQIKNILSNLQPPRLVDIWLRTADINNNKKAADISARERGSLVKLAKNWVITVSGLEDIKRAIITAGGVDLKEINSSTMCSKLFNNLYIAGELLNLEGPTGGFNLQMAWSTGYLAGNEASKNI